MNQGRFYKIVIILLLLLNGGMLAYILMGNGSQNRPDHPPRPDRIIIQRLQLDEGQQDQFRQLRDEHHMQMVEITDKSAELHQQLFALLKQQSPDEQQKDRLLTAIQQVDMQKELVTYEHFRKLRLILREDQLPLFDELVTDIGLRIMAPHKKH